MNFDYRKRCECHTMLPDGTRCVTMRYGVSARDMGAPWVDVRTPFAELSRGGKRPGDPEPREQHFFNRRIM